MIPEISDIRVLSMNIGADQRDYSLLLPQMHLNQVDTTQNLLNEFVTLNDQLKQFRADKAAGDGSEELKTKITDVRQNIALVSEKLFHYLSTDPDTRIEENYEVVVDILFNDGLDILDQRVTESKKGKFFRHILETRNETFTNLLNNKIKDHYGAEQFVSNYPNLAEFLSKNYEIDSLPPALRQALTREEIAKITEKSPVFTRHFQNIKQRLANAFFERVANRNEKPAVIALQEVSDKNETVIDVLKHHNYTVFRPTKDSDTAVAIDSSRFQNIQDLSGPGKFANATVKATDKVSGEEFIFISVHIPGYKLEFPDDKSTSKIHLDTVEKNLSFTNKIIDELNDDVNKFAKLYPNAQIVVQGDFNSYPEYFKDKRINSNIKKLNFFAKLQKKLSITRTNAPTELNQTASSLQERELDYCFTSKSLAKRIRVLETEDQSLTLAKVTAAKNRNKRWFFDPSSLFSDHRPIWLTISPLKRKSKEP